MREFYELVQALARLGKNTGEAALQKVSRVLHRYFSFLGRVSKFFVLFLAVTAALFIFGAVSGSRPVISLAMFMGGMAVFFWLLAISPIIWAVSKGFEWESVRKTFEWIGVFTLWIFFLSIYFFLVPVPLVAIPLVLALTAAMAIASIVFGVGISTRFLALRLGIVFTVMTVLFVLTAAFPSSLGGFRKLIGWVDTEVGGVMVEVATPLPKSVAYGPDLVFFDQRTKEPKVWYYKIDDGTYELYDTPGFQFRYGVKLEPITPEVVRELEKMEKEAKIRIKAAVLAEEQRVAEKKKLSDLEAAVKAVQAKAAEAAKNKVQGQPGPQGPPGPVGEPGPRGEPGQPGRDAVLPELRSFVVSAGTPIEVILDQWLSTGTSTVGQIVRVSLGQAIQAGEKAIPIGTLLEGRITELERPGRTRGTALLALALTGISLEGRFFPIQTEKIRFEGETSRGKDAAKIGGGASFGTLIGGLIGGKEGAIVGGAVGGGVATTETLLTRGEELELKPETKLTFRLARDASFQLQQ